jgi:uncharacterized membrane protein YhfC
MTNPIERKWYKDWWTYVYYGVFIWCIWDLINALDTLQRWKWGYFSIDMIPAILILFLLCVINNYIISERRWKYIMERLYLK